MLALTVREVADLLGGHVHGTPGAGAVPIRGATLDSRRAGPGELFFALRGSAADGHEFAAAAGARGAAGAVVERPLAADLPQIVVPDPRAALGRLARHWRARFDAPVLAVTGSNGKTTVKEMAASCLRAHAGGMDAAPDRLSPVLATAGNLNNDLGLPLTVLGLGPQHRYVVLEMGASAPGEIASLAVIAAPHVGIVTQCAPAHLEGFGSVAGVARAKGELFAALPASGTAVINADDSYLELWMGLASHCHRITFGLRVGADVCGRYVADCTRSRVLVDTPFGRFSLQLPLPGRHNVLNALAVTAACIALGLPLETIRAGLERVPPVAGRLRPRELANGARVLDDTYNANPVSLAAALDVLRGQRGRHWLVLGDMAELGPQGPRLHREAGEAARAAGVERLYTLGELSAHAVATFAGVAHHFDDVNALNAELCRDLEPGVTVLVKGSRSMRMERVVSALLGEE